jgi:uncharacterized LabA/DUF88 family protein
MSKIGIYVDAINVSINGGYGLRYDKLRQYACYPNNEPSRLNVYVSFDQKRADEDELYYEKTERFSSVLRDFEFKVIERPIHRSHNHETGDEIVRSNVEVQMTVDLLEQGKYLDKIVLLTNDEGFIPVINKLQDYGCRVILMGFDNVSPVLKAQADMYVSGLLIPGLLPVQDGGNWGEVGSRVRGLCYDYSHEDGYGFMRYMDKLNEYSWITDSRHPKSPYNTIFAHVSQFEHNFDTSFLPSRDLIFEFDLVENDKGLVAENIVLVSAP